MANIKLDRMVVNVEAQIARRLWDDADAINEKLVALREQIVAEVETAEKAADPLDRARAQAAITELVNAERSLMLTMEAQRDAARAAVADALSLDDETDPAELEPARVEPFEIDPAELEAERWANLRSLRNAMLAASDWSSSADSTAKDKSAWLEYRRQLRDLPENTTDPSSPVWPEEPPA